MPTTFKHWTQCNIIWFRNVKNANCNDYLSPSQYHSYLGLFLIFFFQISVVDEKREETITRINSKLPSCIKVQSIKKVTKNFNCKSACDSRTYLYLLPTFAFAPILPINELKPNEEEVSPEVYKVTYAYRMPSEVRNYVNEILLKFVGSKYYHNYTSGK